MKEFYSSLTGSLKSEKLPFETFFTTTVWDVKKLFVNAYIVHKINLVTTTYRTASIWWDHLQTTNWLSKC